MAAHFPAGGCSVPLPAWLSNDRIIHRPNGPAGASPSRRRFNRPTRCVDPAYRHRIRLLQQIYPGFAADSGTLWQTDSIWQPLREVVEKLLIAYDWAESFIGLNLVLKPLVDELFMNYVSDLALRQDDYLLGQIFYSLNEDCQWHRQWSESLGSNGDRR